MIVLNIKKNNRIDLTNLFEQQKQFINEANEAAKIAKAAARKAEIEAKKAAEIIWQNTPEQYQAIIPSTHVLSFVDNETKTKHDIDIVVKRDDKGYENPLMLHILHNDSVALSLPLKYASFFASCIIDVLDEINDVDC